VCHSTQQAPHNTLSEAHLLLVVLLLVLLLATCG
jgi:hypothetical protein